MQLNPRFLAEMREATQLLQTAGPAAATAAIQRALQGASAASAPVAGKTNAGWAPSMPAPHVLVDSNLAAIADAGPKSAADVLSRLRQSFPQTGERAPFRQPVPDVQGDADLEGKGRFLTASCSNDAGTRAYKIYVPSRYGGQRLPLIVMLHGCKQNPNDFAAGTEMNAIAEQNNCFVAYPAQAVAANGSNCWNWFKSHDQQRDRGEPSIIADITRSMIHEYHIDPTRVYAAGLSAGGAMAAIMGAAYPELYAAVGVHSGLPVGAARDLPSAFAAMKNGSATTYRRNAGEAPIPIILFHGDRDTTVHPCNGDQLLAQCVEWNDAEVTVQEGKVPNGHAYTRAVQHDSNGKAIAEKWIVHGAGHAWSGGSPRGSYTDSKGPNAAREMLRFFQSHVGRKR
jgi:poly(hydroxyalkanoate) depolymerase family esterase